MYLNVEILLYVFQVMINLPEYVVMGNVFKCRDSSICFPSYDKFT